MQTPPVSPASRQQLQDQVLSIIRRQAAAAEPAQKKSAQAADAAQLSDAATQPVGDQQIATAVTQINKTLQTLATNLRFEVDDESGRTLVKVIDQASGDVLRQIPSEATIRIALSLDKMVGHLVDHSI